MSRGEIGRVPNRSSSLTLAILGALALLTPAAAGAQRFEFGRWWWEGLLRWSSGDHATTVDGVETGSYREDTLSAEIALNGYLGHPALGSFRISVAGSENPIRGRVNLGLNQLGYSASVSLLPYSAYPLDLAYGRGSFSTPADGNPSDWTAMPEKNESWSAGLRIRRGFLRGLTFATVGSRLSFVDPDRRPERKEHSYARWSTRRRRSETSFRLDRDRGDFALSGFRSTIWTSTLDHNILFEPRHTWRLSTSGIRVDSAIGEDRAPRVEELRFSSAYTYPLRTDDQFSLDLAGGISRTTFVDDARSYGASLSYRWRPSGPSFLLTPYVQFAESSQGTQTQRTTQEGLALAWNRHGRVDLGFNANVAFGQASRRSAGDRRDDRVAYGGAVNLGFGQAGRLRTVLEVGASRNELRLNRFELDPERPEGRFLLRQIAVESANRVRLGIERRKAFDFTAWVERSVGEVRSIDGDAADRETRTGSLQMSWRRFSLSASGGWIELARPNEPSQTSRYLGGSARWSPLRNLSLDGGVRLDEQRIAPLPYLRNDSWSLGIGYQIGLLQLHAGGFLRRERLESESEVEDRGVRFTATRQLAGWLPIVTGERRRGTIR